MPGLAVRDAMSRDLATVPPTSTVGRAVDEVLRRGHTHVVVVNAAGQLLDIVSAHLLTTALMTRLVRRTQPLETVLARPVTVSTGAGLADAAAVMMECSVDAVGVVDRAGVLVGLLTWADIGRAAVRADRVPADRDRADPGRAERRGPG
ncbi:CBS domain-containing protein [Nocardioides pyridinolyticus]